MPIQFPRTAAEAEHEIWTKISKANDNLEQLIYEIRKTLELIKDKIK